MWTHYNLYFRDDIHFRMNIKNNEKFFQQKRLKKILSNLPDVELRYSYYCEHAGPIVELRKSEMRAAQMSHEASAYPPTKKLLQPGGMVINDGKCVYFRFSKYNNKYCYHQYSDDSDDSDDYDDYDSDDSDCDDHYFL